MRFRDRADLLNADLVDGYGGQQRRGWGDPTTEHVAEARPCSIQPAETDENNADRDTTITTWWMACSPDEPLTEHSRVRWDGHLLEVDGKVARWKRGDQVHHLEARLRLADDSGGDTDG